MKRIGIRHLNLGNTEGLKKQALYFDQIYFDFRAYQQSSFMVASIIAGSLPREVSNEVRDFALETILGPDETTVDYLVKNSVLVPYDGKAVLFNELRMERDESPSPPMPKEHTDFLKDRLGYEVDESQLIKFKFSPHREANVFDKDFIVEFGQLMLSEVNSWFEDETRPPMASLEDVERESSRLSAQNTHRVKFLSILKSLADPDNIYLPIIRDSDLVGDGSLLREQRVAKVILSRFPTPSDDVPWEQLLEFRQDADHAMSLSLLRRWVSKLGAAETKEPEIAEEIDGVLADYEKLLRLHRMRYNIGSLELAVVTTLEILENIVKFNWSSAAKKLFELKNRKVDFALKVSELRGREVAYLAEVRERFAATPSKVPPSEQPANGATEDDPSDN